jgi:two-component system cell cycle response regulator
VSRGDDSYTDRTMVLDAADLNLEQLTPTEGSERRAVVTVLAGRRLGASFEVTQDITVLGRGDEAQIRLDDDGVSRTHARIVVVDDALFLEDKGSTNGTFVNGLKITKERLKHGDRIALGTNTIVKFELQDQLEARLGAEMYQRATRDPLTGLHNRRFFFERLREEFSFAQRHGKPLSLIIFDVDHFKQVNDNYGHTLGDQVLREIGSLLIALSRNEDVCCRYGGEEFVVVARDLDRAKGVAFAERIRKGIGQHPVSTGRQDLHVTVSLGVATLDDMGFDTPEQLLSEADGFLYRAKDRGRNRVESAASVSG